MNLLGSDPRVEETSRRRRPAVAIAQGREFRICRRLSSLQRVSFGSVTTSKASNLTHAIRVSVECSTGSVERDFKKESRPGVNSAVAGAILGLRLVSCAKGRTNARDLVYCIIRSVSYFRGLRYRHWYFLRVVLERNICYTQDADFCPK